MNCDVKKKNSELGTNEMKTEWFFYEVFCFHLFKKSVNCSIQQIRLECFSTSYSLTRIEKNFH
jgi:hypothetical protein